jgi:hypothetical protein
MHNAILGDIRRAVRLPHLQSAFHVHSRRNRGVHRCGLAGCYREASADQAGCLWAYGEFGGAWRGSVGC